MKMKIKIVYMSVKVFNFFVIFLSERKQLTYMKKYLQYFSAWNSYLNLF